MIAGMNIGVKALDPVGDKLDRPSQQLRQCIGCHLVGIDMDLDAERAADILADHAHLLLLKPEMQRRDVLHHVRRLCALIDREPRFRSIPVRHHRPRFQRHSGVPAKDKFRFHNLIGLGKGLIDVARIVIALKSQVVA